jgi:hypothetical protein
MFQPLIEPDRENSYLNIGAFTPLLAALAQYSRYIVILSCEPLHG